jgi:hypothetical protein
LKRLVYYSESSAGKSLLLHAYVCARKLEVWVDNRIYSVEEMLWDEHDWSEYYAAEQEDEYTDEEQGYESEDAEERSGDDDLEEGSGSDDSELDSDNQSADTNLDE